MRQALPALLLGLLLIPLGMSAWLAERALDSLRLEERRLQTERAARELADALRLDVEAALRGAAGVVQLGAAIPLDRPERLEVAIVPDGAELGHAHLLLARERLRQGEWTEALAALDALIAHRNPRLRAVALVRASDVVASVGEASERARRAARLLAKAEETLAAAPSLDPPGSIWRRWASLRHALASTEPDRARRELEAWVQEIEGRATDLEELALTRELCDVSLEAGDTETEALRRRLVERVGAPHHARMAALAMEARSLEAPALWQAGGSWYLVRSSEGGTRAHRVTGLEEAAGSWRGGSGGRYVVEPPPGDEAEPVPPGPISSGPWTVDLAGLRGRLVLPPSTLFGGVDPRLVLVGVLVLYALAAVLLSRALAVQMRRSLALAQAREDLIAEVLHELRTPLTVIRLHVEALARGRARDAGAALRTVQEEALRLGDLVDRVAEVARRGAHREPLEESVDLRPIVAEVTDSFRCLAQAQAGTLETIEHLDGPIVVRGGEEELRRVLEVLLDNAFAYSPAPARVRVELEADPREVRVRVRDWGPGIPPPERSRVFERWTRGSAGRRGGRRGAGMGLALARETAQRMGGGLELAFPEDGGTEARVRLERVAPEGVGWPAS